MSKTLNTLRGMMLFVMIMRAYSRNATIERQAARRK